MSQAEKIDTVLADPLLPAASKALYLQLVKAGGEGEFGLFSAQNSDHPKELEKALKRLVGKKYVEVYRFTYKVV